MIYNIDQLLYKFNQLKFKIYEKTETFFHFFFLFIKKLHFISCLRMRRMQVRVDTYRAFCIFVDRRGSNVVKSFGL